MAGQKFSLESDRSLDNSAVLANGRTIIHQSAVTDNAQGSDGYLYDSLRIVVDYENYMGSYANSLRAVVESSNGESGAAEKWFPVAYQFEGFYDNGGNNREILLQPNLIVIDVGVDDIVWDGGFAAAISRQQGKLGADFRISLVLNETAHGQPGAFQSVDVSIYGEMFDAFK